MLPKFDTPCVPQVWYRCHAMFVHPAERDVNTLWYMSSGGPRPALRHAIRDAMQRRGIRRVTELVDRAQVTRNTIYNWEGGKSAPALDQLDAVARALDVPLSYLVDAWSGRAHEKEPQPQWAEALPAQVADAVVTRLRGDDALLAEIHDDVHGSGLPEPPPAVAHPKAGRRPRGRRSGSAP